MPQRGAGWTPRWTVPAWPGWWVCSKQPACAGSPCVAANPGRTFQAMTAATAAPSSGAPTDGSSPSRPWLEIRADPLKQATDPRSGPALVGRRSRASADVRRVAGSVVGLSQIPERCRPLQRRDWKAPSFEPVVPSIKLATLQARQRARGIYEFVHLLSRPCAFAKVTLESFGLPLKDVKSGFLRPPAWVSYNLYNKNR